MMNKVMTSMGLAATSSQLSGNPQLMAGNQSATQQTFAEVGQTDRLEQKIIEDLTSMIHDYDFNSVFAEALTEEQARQVAWQAEYKPSVQELLKKLQDALKEDAQLEQMWPDARLKDKEMFSHLNLEFDLTSDQITVETAAKDYHGVPIYQFVYDTDDKTAVEITNIEDQGIQQEVIPTVAPVVTPATPTPTSETTIAPVVTPAVTPAEAAIATIETTAVSGLDETAVEVILTPEEQREVAFKVVGFFIMLIIASFTILYIYHNISQKKVKSRDQKKTFYEFLAGQIDDTYPLDRTALTNTRYQL